MVLEDIANCKVVFLLIGGGCCIALGVMHMRHTWLQVIRRTGLLHRCCLVPVAAVEMELCDSLTENGVLELGERPEEVGRAVENEQGDHVKKSGEAFEIISNSGSSFPAVRLLDLPTRDGCLHGCKSACKLVTN